MNGIFIIPTGIGCEIGGHAGDANPAVKLIASTCDKLIVNPNAVNASDINEMPDNALYVEGSMIDRFLKREFYLQEVKSNKILVVTNPLLKIDVVNSVNTARAIIGIEAEIVVLDHPLTVEELIKQIQKYSFDALAIATQIYDLEEVSASELLCKAINKPVVMMVLVDSLYCILKGLWKAPQIITNEFKGFPIQAVDIDFLISPMCYGEPHKTCQNRGIPIIFVEENKTIYKDEFPIRRRDVIVKNYIEAAGVIQAMKEGISLDSLQRPLEGVKVHEKEEQSRNLSIIFPSTYSASSTQKIIESPHR